MMCSRRRRQWLCSGGDGTVKFKMLQIWLKIEMQRIFQSEPVMAKGYRKDTEESKGDVFTAAAVAVQWRCRMVKEVFCSKRCKDRSK